jgi:nitrogen fixation/metabolism regulation signal transduction histidine kinase
MTAIAGVAVVVLSIFCGLATYLILTGLAPIKPNRELIMGLMAANLFLVATMAGMIGWQV